MKLSDQIQLIQDFVSRQEGSTIDCWAAGRLTVSLGLAKAEALSQENEAIDRSNVDLWERGNNGDEEALIEIEARGFDVEEFLQTPVEELL